MELKEFDKTDWDSFAGAESFSDKEPPLLGDSGLSGNYFLIADKLGIELYVGSEYVYKLDAEHSPAFYKFLVKNFPEVIEHEFLREMGFKLLYSEEADA